MKSWSHPFLKTDVTKMLFTVAPPVSVAKYSTKNLSDDEGGEEILEVMVTSVFKNGCDKKG